MNIRQLQYFLAVARDLNFTRAAERMHIAQPPLSQQIIALEQELGVKLFKRGKPQVQLTPAGAILVEHSQRIINATSAAMEAVRASGRGVQSTIAVGAVYSAIYTFLPDVLRLFAKAAPQSEVNLQEMTIFQQVNALKEGIIEVGLLRGPIFANGIHTEVLIREPFVVAVPEGSDYALPGPISIAQVAEAPLIAVSRGTHRGYGDRILDLFEMREIHPRISHFVSDMHTSICLVAAGLGLSIVPAIMQKVQMRGVVYRRVAEQIPNISLSLAWRDGPITPLMSSFCDAAREATRTLCEENHWLQMEAPRDTA